MYRCSYVFYIEDRITRYQFTAGLGGGTWTLVVAGGHTGAVQEVLVTDQEQHEGPATWPREHTCKSVFVLLPGNVSILPCAEGRHTCIVRLPFDTSGVAQNMRFRPKPAITPDTFHPLRSWLNDLAPKKHQSIVTSFDTIHLLMMSALKSSRPSNNAD